MVIVDVAAPYVASAAMEAVSTQLPSATAVTVVPDRVQIPIPPARVQVTRPEPIDPEVRSVVVSPGRRRIDEALAEMLCDASDTVKVTAVEPAE